MDRLDRQTIARTIAQELGEIYPWAEGASALSSGSFGHAFLLCDGVTVAKFRSGQPEDETHEGHNLKCLARVNDGCVLVPEFRHETNPFQFHGRPCVITFMSYLSGYKPKKIDIDYEEFAETIGRMHHVFNIAGNISNGLLPSYQFTRMNREGVLQNKFEIVAKYISPELQRKLEAVLTGYFRLSTRPTWVHGDVEPRNLLVQTNGQYGFIDLGFMHKAPHPELEFFHVDHKYYPKIIEGYKSSTGIQLDECLFSSFNLMFFVGNAYQTISYNPNISNRIEKALEKVRQRLVTPKNFYGDFLPYGLEG